MQAEDIKAVVEHALDAILVSNDAGRVVYANRAAVRLLDLAHGTSGSPGIADLLWDPSSVERPELALRTLGTRQVPLALRRRDGSRVVVEGRTVSGFPLRLHLSILVDVSGRATLARALPADDEGGRLALLQRAIESASCGTTICEAEGDHPVVYANRAFEAMTGYRLEELRGRNLAFLLGKDAGPEEPIPTTRAASGHQGAHATVRNYRKNGQAFAHRMLIEPVFGDDGRVVYLFGIHDDVSQQQALREDFVDRSKVLQAGRLAAVGELAVGVSHEIKNPLMMMTGLLELALQGLAAGDVDAAAQDIQDALAASTRITGVLDRLQEFAQPDSRGDEAVGLTDLLERTRRLLDERLGLAGITLTLDIPGDVVVKGNAASLGQVFLHLLLNAREAIGAHGGWIRVRLAEHGEDSVALVVQDSGPGVPESLRERIFDPYFSTKPASSGTGLGLAISQEVLRANGGHLTYEDLPGVGASFRLELPRYMSSIEPPAPAPSRAGVDP